MNTELIYQLRRLLLEAYDLGVCHGIAKAERDTDWQLVRDKLDDVLTKDPTT